MSVPRPASYGGSVYARGGLVTAPPGSLTPPPSAPAFRSAGPVRPAVTFLTVAEVAAQLRVSKMTVYRLIHGGELGASRIGRSFRVPQTALEQYMADSDASPREA